MLFYIKKRNMKSTRETPKPPTPPAILLLGPPGSGKTTLCMQFPRVNILDCDANLDGPERVNRKRNADLDYDYELIRQDDKGNAIPTHECYERLMKKIEVVGANKDVLTLVVDSLTHVNEFIIQHLLKKQNRLEGGMEPRDWGPFKSNAYKFFIAWVQEMGKMKVYCCHERIVLKTGTAIGQEVVDRYEPSFQGGICDYLGGFFTDVWRCEFVSMAGGVKAYVVHTQKNPQSDLKCSFPVMASHEEKGLPRGTYNVTNGAEALIKDMALASTPPPEAQEAK